MQLLPTCILLISLSHGGTAASDAAAEATLPFSNSTAHLSPFPTPHPDPEVVVQHLQRRVEESTRRALLGQRSAAAASSSCLTGNPIDDCWRCEPNWESNRQRLADCGIGFGRDALGGKGGQIYVVSDSSDQDAVNPKPGTLRHAVIQEEPLWIVFSANMLIRLCEELIVNSFKTIDGRGANVHITGGGCITLQYVSNVIIHGVNIHHCVPSGEANVRSTPTHAGWRGKSDGDGISIYGSRKIWVDHCSLSHCADGLVDAIMGSTGITISNNYFAHHNEVMLLGHSDDYAPDAGMQVTIAFNRFGEALVQRMPRCRLGYIHIVNNDFTRTPFCPNSAAGRPPSACSPLSPGSPSPPVAVREWWAPRPLPPPPPAPPWLPSPPPPSPPVCRAGTTGASALTPERAAARPPHRSPPRPSSGSSSTRGSAVARGSSLPGPWRSAHWRIRSRPRLRRRRRGRRAAAAARGGTGSS